MRSRGLRQAARTGVANPLVGRRQQTAPKAISSAAAGILTRAQSARNPMGAGGLSEAGGSRVAKVLVACRQATAAKVIRPVAASIHPEIENAGNRMGTGGLREASGSRVAKILCGRRKVSTAKVIRAAAAGVCAQVQVSGDRLGTGGLRETARSRVANVLVERREPAAAEVIGPVAARVEPEKARPETEAVPADCTRLPLPDCRRPGTAWREAAAAEVISSHDTRVVTEVKSRGQHAGPAGLAGCRRARIADVCDWRRKNAGRLRECAASRVTK